MNPADELPRQVLERARRMAVSKGWTHRVALRKHTPIGEEVLVPSPGQEVGSGARPSKFDPKPVAFIVDHLVKQLGWKEKLDVAAVAVRWPELVGKEVAANCQVENFSDTGVLTLRAASTSWKTQLEALAVFIDSALAKELGEGVVKEIVINGPHTPSWGHGKYRVPGRGPRDTYG